MRLLAYVLTFVYLVSSCANVLAADNISILDGNRVARTLAAKDLAGVHTYKMMIVDSTGAAIDFGPHGGIGVTPHEHSSHGVIHLGVDNIVADQRYVLIDLSDTTNWPHTDTAAIHIEHLDFQVDSDTNGAYQAHLEFIDNCSATDCDTHQVWGISGSKTTGNNAEVQVNWGSTGPVFIPGNGSILSNHNTVNDTNYQTDVALKSVLDSDTATVLPGNGDLILYIDWIAGTFNVHVNIAYHTHDADHP